MILGAGPGGTGPLIWAAQHGLLEDWIAQGIVVVDRAAAFGGTIGRYIVNSDSLGAAYLECLDAPPARALFGPLRGDPVTREMERWRDGFPPLSLVGEYLHRLCGRLADAVTGSINGAFVAKSEVRSLRLRTDGSLAAEVVAASGEAAVIEARTAILALGGRSVALDSPDRVIMPPVRLSSIDPRKLVLSDVLFTDAGFSHAMTNLAASSRRRVVILGGRHSAFSAAWLLTQRMPVGFFCPEDITIICRREAPIFYATREEAEADGAIVDDRDICPRTRRVHRFSGMRGDGRELWRRLHARPGTLPENRVRVLPLSDLSPARLCQALDEASLVVAAFGYRATTIPIFDAAGRRVRLRADHGGPAVGCDARLLLTTGGSLANVFGIGLGTGYQPWGAMGGEENLEGQTNSLWLYQNHIGEVIYRGIQNWGCAPTPLTHLEHRAPAPLC